MACSGIAAVNFCSSQGETVCHNVSCSGVREPPTVPDWMLNDWLTCGFTTTELPDMPESTTATEPPTTPESPTLTFWIILFLLLLLLLLAALLFLCYKKRLECKCCFGYRAIYWFNSSKRCYKSSPDSDGKPLKCRCPCGGSTGERCNHDALPRDDDLLQCSEEQQRCNEASIQVESVPPDVELYVPSTNVETTQDDNDGINAAPVEQETKLRPYPQSAAAASTIKNNYEEHRV